MILYDHIHKVRKQKHVAGIKNIPKRSKIDVYTHTCIYIYVCVCMLNIYIYIALSPARGSFPFLAPCGYWQIPAEFFRH